MYTVSSNMCLPKFQYLVIYAYFLHTLGSVHATECDGMGRMVNDATYPHCNCKVMVFRGCVDGKTRLCLFAIKTIEINCELRFDYGVTDLPWRKEAL